MFRIFIHAYALFVIYGLLHPSHTEGQGVRNDDGSYTFSPETIQVTKHQHNLTVKSVMLLSNVTVSVDEVQLFVFTEKNGGSLVSLRPNSAGVFVARVNPKMVRDFKLKEAGISMKSEVNVTYIPTGQVRVYTVFNLRLSNTTLGGNSVVVHKLVVVVTSHDKKGTEYRHDQHYSLNYTETQTGFPGNVSSGSVHFGPTSHQKDNHTAKDQKYSGFPGNVSSGSVHIEPTRHQKDNHMAKGAVSSSNLAVLIAVPTVSLAVLITICIACVVLKRKNNRAIYDAENPINTMMGKLSGQG